MENKPLFQKLAELVEERVKHNELWDKLMEQKKGLVKPTCPKAFESEEQYVYYQEHLESYERNQRINDAAIKGWGENSKVIDRELFNTLPCKNIWFKVQVNGEFKAVGYCTDAWGGYHFVAKIAEWREDLPKLTDTLYYS